MCLKFFSWNVRVSDVNFLMMRKMCAKNPFPIKHVLTTWNTAYMPLSIKSTSMNNKNWYRGIMQSGYLLLRQKFGCQADQIQLSGTCRNRTRRLSLCLSLSVLHHQFTCCLAKYWAPDWALWVKPLSSHMLNLIQSLPFYILKQLVINGIQWLYMVVLCHPNSPNHEKSFLLKEHCWWEKKHLSKLLLRHSPWTHHSPLCLWISGMLDRSYSHSSMINFSHSAPLTKCILKEKIGEWGHQKHSECG